MFYFFYKIIIFRLNKEKDYIQSAYVHFLTHKFSQLGDRANHIANVIFVLHWHSAMKTHLCRVIDQSKHTTIQIIL